MLSKLCSCGHILFVTVSVAMDSYMVIYCCVLKIFFLCVRTEKVLHCEQNLVHVFTDMYI